MTRNILFSFVGETPEVVTETLYCLLRDYGTSDGQVHLLTTRKMEDNAFNLIKEWIERFNKEYDTEWKPCVDANFAWENHEGGVQVLSIEDISTEDANDKAIDAITRIIYYWTSRNDVELYVSVAGGRKQLGSYMYQALSWFGQPDRTKLCHVIPSEELEGGNPNGWIGGYFPKPGTGESATEKASNASHGYYVHFVEQPIVYLQHFLPDFSRSKGEVGNQDSIKLSDFNQPYLDEEQPGLDKTSFPFNEISATKSYLTFNNIFNRFHFIQGLSNSSLQKVKVILSPSEKNNFVVETNGFTRSVMIDQRYLFLFYFLYINEYYSKRDFIEDSDQLKRLDLALDWFLSSKSSNDDPRDLSGLIGFNLEGQESWCKKILLLSKHSYNTYLSRIQAAEQALGRAAGDFNAGIEQLKKLRESIEVERIKLNKDEALAEVADYLVTNFSFMDGAISREFAPSGLKIHAPSTSQRKQSEKRKHFRKFAVSDPDLLEVLRRPGEVPA